MSCALNKVQYVDLDMKGKIFLQESRFCVLVSRHKENVLIWCLFPKNFPGRSAPIAPTRALPVDHAGGCAYGPLPEHTWWRFASPRSWGRIRMGSPHSPPPWAGRVTEALQVMQI